MSVLYRYAEICRKFDWGVEKNNPPPPPRPRSTLSFPITSKNEFHHRSKETGLPSHQHPAPNPIPSHVNRFYSTFPFHPISIPSTSDRNTVPPHLMVRPSPNIFSPVVGLFSPSQPPADTVPSASLTALKIIGRPLGCFKFFVSSKPLFPTD